MKHIFNFLTKEPLLITHANSNEYLLKAYFPFHIPKGRINLLKDLSVTQALIYHLSTYLLAWELFQLQLLDMVLVVEILAYLALAWIT